MAQPAEKIWTVGALLQWTEQYLTQKQIESPRLDAQILLAHVLACERIQIYTRFEEPVDEPRRTRFRELIQRRVEGCPVAYLVGRKEFYKFSFEVTPAVLIPRPATESLVLAALERIKPLTSPRVLDVGTGSGCIAISIARQKTDATVVAVDTSTEALAIARRNAKKHSVVDRVTFMASDLFSAIGGESPFDLIVSNPPYIASDVLATLAPEVRDHEPHLALDGGPDGFAVFDRLVAQAPVHLKKNGWLLIEIGADQEAEATRRVSATSQLKPAPVVCDADGLPRVVIARHVTE